MITSRRRIALAFAVLMFAPLCFFAVPASAAEEEGDWMAYGRTQGAGRFSPLAQINRGNVANLTRAWTYNHGDLKRRGMSARYAFECAPLVIDGVMYIVTPLSRAIALDAATGKELWAYDSGFAERFRGGGLLASRGLSYWADGDDRRIFLPTFDGRLIALNAADALIFASSIGSR